MIDFGENCLVEVLRLLWLRLLVKVLVKIGLVG